MDNFYEISRNRKKKKNFKILFFLSVNCKSIKKFREIFINFAIYNLRCRSFVRKTRKISMRSEQIAGGLAQAPKGAVSASITKIILILEPSRSQSWSQQRSNSIQCKSSWKIGFNYEHQREKLDVWRSLERNPQ